MSLPFYCLPPNCPRCHPNFPGQTRQTIKPDANGVVPAVLLLVTCPECKGTGRKTEPTPEHLIGSKD